MADLRRSRDELYEEAAASCRAALDRLARAYEPDPDKRRDLLQEIHVALWLSLADYEGRCSLNTWVYRVAHNTATSVVTRRKANAPRLVGLEEVQPSWEEDSRHAVDHQDELRSLWELIYTLTPHDKQIILLYLEGLDAASIGEITGFSPGNIATKIHRIKNLLSRQFHQGQRHGQ
jgi:RNA polymerase sigma-70 factor, ECF subfamily